MTNLVLNWQHYKFVIYEALLSSRMASVNNLMWRHGIPPLTIWTTKWYPCGGTPERTPCGYSFFTVPLFALWPLTGIFKAPYSSPLSSARLSTIPWGRARQYKWRPLLVSLVAFPLNEHLISSKMVCCPRIEHELNLGLSAPVLSYPVLSLCVGCKWNCLFSSINYSHIHATGWLHT